MSFCEHCDGQRFDRAQVLRVLRATQKNISNQKEKEISVDAALHLVIMAVRTLEIPHLEMLDDVMNDTVVH
jgi:hypothetical protein